MSKDDARLMDKIMKDKERYAILVDNDAIHVEDTINRDMETFDEYGYHFIVVLFQYLGFESDYV